MKCIVKKTLIIFLFYMIAVGTSCTEQHAVYVSNKGSDVNTGTKSKPLATLAGARDRARALLKAGKGDDINVWIAEGVYRLDAPIVFGPEDSGTGDRTVRYRAMPGSAPKISGGVEIREWTRRRDGIWRAELPAALRTAPEVREIFVEGMRAQRARHPNSGYLRVEQVGEDRRTNFYFGAGDFPIPDQVDETELVLLHDWSSSRIKLKTVDVDSRRIVAADTIGPRRPSFFAIDNWEPHPRYYLENDRAFLDSAYEWYADKLAGEVFLLLPDGVHPDSLHIEAPYASKLLHFEGSQEKPVSNIQFEGLTFEYCRWDLPRHGYGGVQACHYDPGPQKSGWAVVPPAVGGAWMHNIVFKECSIRRLGGSGIWFGPGSRNCAAIGCEITDVSGNGLMIGEGRDRIVEGEPWYMTRPRQAASGNVVRDCIITRCGQQFFGAVGVWGGLAAGTTISGNELSDLPYTGISLGWMWSTQPTPCRENIIDGNHIHHIMGKLSDGGGIYMLGLQPGSRLSRNLIHDVTLNAGRAESNGMFLDEGTTDIVISQNIIYNIAKSPLRFHRATTNLVINNVLACGEGIPPVRYNNTLEEHIEMEGNRVLYTSDPAHMQLLSRAVSAWRNQTKGENTP